MQRLPDFVIVGAMKAGTTSLYRWLGEQPEVWLPETKEPDFFSDDARWSRGISWYEELFADAPEGAITGEASVSYSDPGCAAFVAERMRQVVPEARLVYVVRDPIERLLSHYRHEVQRGRERRPFADAAAGMPNPYVARSSYARAISPYMTRFPRGQMLVIRFEDLVAEGSPAWEPIMRHLGLRARPAPGTTHNVTAGKARYTAPLRWIWKRGWDRRLRWVPRPVRRIGYRVMSRENATYRRLLDTARRDQVPPRVVAALANEVAELAQLIGTDPLWQTQGEPWSIENG
jgi:Sulfotransferase domain